MRRLLPRLLSRLGAAAVVVWLTATLVFFALQVGGSPLTAALGGPGSQASDDAVAQVRAQYGLDQPLLVQYFTQLWRALTLQFGESLARKEPVWQLLGESLPATLGISLAALLLAWALLLLSLTLGAAARGLASRRSARSHITGPLFAAPAAALRLADTLAALTPNFVTGALLVALSTTGFAAATGLAPQQFATASAVLTLALPTAGYLALLARDALGALDSAAFVQAARARGCGEVRLLFTHSLRHSLPPLLAVTGWAFGTLVGGSVVVEAMFARPGLGRLLLEAATLRDVPVVVAVVTVLALAYVAVLAAVDVVTAALGVERA